MNHIWSLANSLANTSINYQSLPRHTVQSINNLLESIKCMYDCNIASFDSFDTEFSWFISLPMSWWMGRQSMWQKCLQAKPLSKWRYMQGKWWVILPSNTLCCPLLILFRCCYQTVAANYKSHIHTCILYALHNHVAMQPSSKITINLNITLN